MPRVRYAQGLAGRLWAGKGVVDAYSAWSDFADKPTAGGFAKAIFKTALVGVKTSPVVSLVLAVADITGVTDWLFKW